MKNEGLFDRSQILESCCCNFLKPKWVGRDSVCTVWVVWVVNCVICEINHVLVCLRPKMAVGSGFTK